MTERLRFAATLLILAGTVFVIAAGRPEVRVVSSADGRVTLKGEWRSDAEVSVDLSPEAVGPYTAVLFGPYQFYPSDLVLTTPFSVSFNFSTQDLSGGDPRALRVAFYDADFGIWRTGPTNISATAASAHVHSFDAPIALLLLDEIARPNFDAEINELIAAAPEGAVGYELAVGYAQVPGDFVVIEGMERTGGCGGQYRSGTTTRLTSRGDKFSDGLEYQIVVVWQIGDGCAGREIIE